MGSDCGGKQKSLQTIVQAWTSGDAANDLFFTGGPALPTIEWVGGKASLEIQDTSDAASIEVKRAYQLSNDGITWDTAVVMTTDTAFVSALGYDYGTAGTVAPLTKRLIRFGLLTNQKAGTAIEQIRVRYMLDITPR